MFDFTIKHLGFLKHIPLLPHLFDALMRIDKSLSDKEVLAYVDEIEKEVLSWDRTFVSLHRFGGIQFNANGKEIGHIHGNGLLDILFSREIKNELIKEKKALEHHSFRKSGWIGFYIRNEQDKNSALELLKRSYRLKIHS